MTRIPAMILAGGLARRMGGGDKPLRLLGGRPLLAHVIARIGPQTGALALNANGEAGRFADFGLPVLADPVPGHPGPLAGVLAAMDWARGLGAAQVLTVPGDTPFLPPDLVARLLAAAETPGAAIAAVMGPEGVRRHPVCGLWPVAWRDGLAAALARGERRIGFWAAAQGAADALFEEGEFDAFLNLNTPEDLAEAEARMAAPACSGGGERDGVPGREAGLASARAKTSPIARTDDRAGPADGAVNGFGGGHTRTLRPGRSHPARIASSVSPVFDAIVIVDWSAKSTPSPRTPSADAIWTGQARRGVQVRTRYHRTRAAAVAWLDGCIADAAATGDRLLIGADFPFGYPAGFAAGLAGQARALAVWDWLAETVEDGPDNRNNRFALAARMNARFPGTGPFWGRPRRLDCPGLPEGGRARTGHGLPERRAVEEMLRGAQPCWKLHTTGSVGSQAILGIAALARLRARHAPRVAVWPFESIADAPVVLAEIWPSVLAPQVRAEVARTGEHGVVKDEAQVALLAATLLGMQADDGLSALFAPPAPPEILTEEGWILGAEAVDALRAACPVPCPFQRDVPAE